MQIINLRFEGGDERPPVDRFVLVDVPEKESVDFLNTLSDSFASYMEHAFDEEADTPYTTAVKSVLDACGRKWMDLHVDVIRI